MKSYSSKLWIHLIPALLFLILPFFGIITAVRHSIFADGGFTLDFYQKVFQSDRFFSSMAFSIRTSFIATALAIMIGLILVRLFHPYLAKLSPRISVWLPMLFPHFVWGYLVILLLAESGLFAQVLSAIGWIDGTNHFPILTRDPYGFGIIITYVWKEVPFAILMLLPVYAAIPTTSYDVVKTLGGNRWDQFKTVEWPHIQPTLIETCLIIFSFTLTAYEVPALIGTTYPEMVSVLSYQWFYGGSWDERPLAFAVMVCVSIVIFMIALTSYLYLNRRRMRAMRGRL
ncbi:ABC transporter permease [Halobacillus ihumii]|uniref:ABC transporter permease n=1 Tax=Halobacillus ihumii TaxID=2686092 RepID=UPI0013D8BDA2|nr:ABC transporter permease subunit [Halobacillus ihumii]